MVTLSTVETEEAEVTIKREGSEAVRFELLVHDLGPAQPPSQRFEWAWVCLDFPGQGPFSESDYAESREDAWDVAIAQAFHHYDKLLKVAVA